jgi:hypothetical protein
MTKMLQILPRHQLNTEAWNTCVKTSSQRIVYGYSWYLDAVLPAPDWKWVGIVLWDKSGQYRAVMPVPLRRKTIAGITYEWVVHQPFFCQFLSVFSADETVDTESFFQKMVDEFRYSSGVCLWPSPDKPLNGKFVEVRTTHILNLGVGYQAIYQNYTRDRKINLRRAISANWTLIESNDPEPLLALFREHHADTIEGGVADWAYVIFGKLFSELEKHNLAVLRYAVREGRIEAGALFVREGCRLIYLFNAASEIGRRGNARTLLIDQLFRSYAGKPVVFDFESPAKQSIRNFYQSFGVVEEGFWVIRWNRLNWVEQSALSLNNQLRKISTAVSVRYSFSSPSPSNRAINQLRL